ncbi:hypothetical protein ACLM5H_11860 [Fredinandcohnia humi]
MFGIFYNRYKVVFWLILAFLFGTGSISNIYTGTKWEVALNASLGTICLVVSIVLIIKKGKKEK